jgi:hypothetical protein
MGVWETRGSSAMEEAKAGSGIEPAKAYRALKRDAFERNCLRVNGAIEFIRRSPGERARGGTGTVYQRKSREAKSEDERSWEPICLRMGRFSYGHNGKESAIMEEADRVGIGVKSAAL